MLKTQFYSSVPIIPSLLLSQDMAALNHNHSTNHNRLYKTAQGNHSSPASTVWRPASESKTHLVWVNHLNSYGSIIKHGNQPLYNDGGSGNNRNYNNTPVGTDSSSYSALSTLAFNENSRVGWLLSSKAIVQLFVNPFIGPLCKRLGYPFLLLSGTVLLAVSSTLFSMAHSYIPLLAARSIHGLGTAATAIAGMSVLASHYSDDRSRSKAMGIAMGGSALGVVLGYPVGGIMNAFVGATSVFLMLTGLLILDLGLQLFTSGLVVTQEAHGNDASFRALLKDHYILVASGAVMLTTMSMSALEPTVPLWVMSTMKAEDWQLGLVFLPDSIGYLIGTNCFGIVARKIGRWIITIACMLLISLCLICLPFASSIPQLILPHFGLGLGLGITDAAIMPLLALLVDLRHQSFYGCVYAIAQQAVCLAYSLGPLMAGFIVKSVGFSWFIRSMAILNVIYCPLVTILSSAPNTSDEDMPLTKRPEKETGKLELDEASFSYGRLHEDED